jgi:hypothetical protein
MTYKVIEIDANDKPMILRTGLTRRNALTVLQSLRNAFGQAGLRYVMYREKP